MQKYKQKKLKTNNPRIAVLVDERKKTTSSIKAKFHISSYIYLCFLFLFLYAIFQFTIKYFTKKEGSIEISFTKDSTLTIFNQVNEEILFDIEIAKDEFKKEKGMMYRTSLEENQGMFFVFDKQDTRIFWMKNTYISLDIIFIDEKFVIVDIHENAFPLKEDAIVSKLPAKYVLEIKGGLSKKKNIKIGDKLIVANPF